MMPNRKEPKRTTRTDPEIIIKFQEGGALEKKGGKLRAEHLKLARFRRMLEAIPKAEARRSFRMETKRMREMQRRAERTLKRRLPSLDLFVRIRVPEGFEDFEEVIRRFGLDPEVEYACLAGVPGPPPSPDFTAQQDYAEAAPDGVDAPFAWFYPGGEGNGVNVCDCEYGFNDSHEDLPAVNVVSNDDGDLTSFEYHGTAVLGEMAGEPDAQGVTGICHGATFMFASESGGHRLDCINDAVAALGAGDVLVLEMQTGVPYKPAEYDSDVHAAVTTAVGNGVVVVAAAGNGNANLTTSTNSQGKFIWDPAHADYDDSGAIIVGAGGSNANADPHSKLSFSTYGARVNCQGWGEDVVTTGNFGDLYDGGANAEYTDSFNGTSSATPIVAGVVACMQGAAVQALGAPLSPATVRTVVSDPTHGTPQADSVAYPAATFHIGPLPDLRRVLRAAAIFPDVFMRDNVLDTGTEPYMGSVLCYSPDIFARPAAAADPATEFGVASWNDYNLGSTIEWGQDNFVYVRMENRGNAPDDVTVTVYWAEAGSFIHPSTWTLIGTLNANNIGPGERRVEGPLLWPQATIPADGTHCCLIGVVNSARDPITIPGAFTSVADYLDFIRNHNNICYRNANVVDVVPGTPAPPFDFDVNGSPEKGEHFRLEIRHRLPKGAKVEVVVGRPLRRFETIENRKGLPFPVRILDRETGFHLKGNRPLILDDLFVRRRGVLRVEFRVKLREDVTPGEYMVYADQFTGKVHLGRVNYVLRVGKGRVKQKAK
ncbi:MAG: S8 family serine peptidase [bacterium]|nr:S8 family serine peptidase [bacterium]